jgi:hypothetical protein
MTDEKPVRFDLPSCLLAMIRDSDQGMTREEMKNRLFAEFRQSPTMGTIDRALGRLTSDGVTHDGTHLKKDRVYRMPETLYEADAALTGRA